MPVSKVRTIWTQAQRWVESTLAWTGLSQYRKAQETHTIHLRTRNVHGTSDDDELLRNDHNDPTDDDVDASSNADTNTNSNSEQTTPSKRQYLKGVHLCASASSIVLLLNIILFAVATGLANSSKNRAINNTNAIFEGSCTLTKRWDIALHFIINVLSTVILAASNYCMQSLVAPTRNDVDKAHAKRMLLDIGVPSMRNLRVMRAPQLVIWGLLLITATPFHLFYNSAVFASLSTNEYGVIVAPSNVDTQNISTFTTDALESCFSVVGPSWNDFAENILNGSFERLTKQQCVDSYARTLLSGSGTVVVLSDDLTNTGDGHPSILFGGFGQAPGQYDDYSWLCGESSPCNKTGLDSNIDAIQIMGYPFPTPTWAFDLPTSNGSSLVTFVSGLQGNFSLYDCFDKTNSNSTCSDATSLVDWIDQTDPTEIQQVNDYIQENTTTKNITGIHVYDANCPLSSSQGNYSLDGCLRQTVEERCRLLYNLPICVTIIGCAIVKVVCMFLAARLDREEPLLTIGDAVASFLTRPDPTTAGMCSMDDVWKESKRRHIVRRQGPANHTEQSPVNKEYPDLMVIPKKLCRRKFWMQAASFRRWAVTLLLCGICLGIGGYFVSTSIASVAHNSVVNNGVNDASFKSLWSMGFGTIQSTAIIDAPLMRHLSVSGMVLVANSPQLIVTMCYYSYNSVLTGMLAAAEYSSYGIKRKPLRVSFPQKGSLQRSTYWLSVPYRYSIPLLTFYIALHLLISQSIFYVQIVPFDSNQQPQFIAQISALCYSPIAIIFALIVGGVMVLALISLGARRFKSNMPLAGSYSAAISAQCHLSVDDDREEVALGRVTWGETVSPPVWAVATTTGSSIAAEGGNAGDNKMEYLAHCCFTSRAVVRPSMDKVYA